MYNYESIPLLLGETFHSIKNCDDRIVSFQNQDTTIHMYHNQSCCETVAVEEIIGDLEDLMNSPILRAEERTEDGKSSYGKALYTFYEIATIKGSVTIRWLGESNGYYGVSVCIRDVS